MTVIVRNSAPVSSNLTANAISSGSGTTNVVANSIVVVSQSSSSQANLSATRVGIGNATANLVATYNQIYIGNSTVNAVINGTALSLGSVYNVNATGEVVGNGCNFSYVKVGNSSVFTYANSTVLSVGSNTANTTVNSSFINVASMKVQTNTFNLGSSSITANGGYTVLPNGLIMQWGKILANTSTGNYTLPTPFPTALFQVTVASDTTGVYGYYALANTSTLWLRSSSANATTVNISFIAVGN